MARFHTSHQSFHPHHKYQLEIIFLFFLGIVLFFFYYLYIEHAGLGMVTYQWYFTLPWTAIYTLWCLRIRNTIPEIERIPPLRRPFVHWVLLGIALIAWQLEPVNLERFYSIDLTFLIFTLFLADSYWDFI